MQFSAITAFALFAPLISAIPLNAFVRVQLNGLSELAIQKEIPIDQSAAPFSGRFTDGFIVNANGNGRVSCQAFSDAAGAHKVGGRFGASDVVFNAGSSSSPAPVGSVRCSVQ